MSNLFDYLTWRNDLTFSKVPCCAVDLSLIHIYNGSLWKIQKSNDLTIHIYRKGDGFPADDKRYAVIGKNHRKDWENNTDQRPDVYKRQTQALCSFLTETASNSLFKLRACTGQTAMQRIQDCLLYTSVQPHIRKYAAQPQRITPFSLDFQQNHISVKQLFIAFVIV